MNGRQELLNQIRAEDFALYESALYLDTHPRCTDALSYYGERKRAVETLKQRYECTYGPLTLYGNTDCACWRWAEGPWPWEKEAN